MTEMINFSFCCYSSFFANLHDHKISALPKFKAYFSKQGIKCHLKHGKIALLKGIKNCMTKRLSSLPVGLYFPFPTMFKVLFHRVKLGLCGKG